MTEHAVVIAGGGPTGLMLAAELAIAGVDVAIVERRENQEVEGSRAGGLHARSLEIFDMRGIVDRFLAEGQKTPMSGFALTPLPVSDFPTRHNYTLGLWQKHIERIMAHWVGELPVKFYRGREVKGFTQSDRGVVVETSSGSLSAQYLVGCDGGRSVIRKTAGIEFPGWDASTSSLIAEAEMKESPPLGMKRDEKGIHGLGRTEYEIVDGKIVYKDVGPVRVMITEARPTKGEATLRDLSEGLKAVYGTDFGVHSPSSLSRFSDATRQAATYRKGRVLLAGDAAHIHAPTGGQGLNTGVQDAVNLGWKLAQVVKGTSPERLLDTYHAERHPVAARVLKNTMAQIALMRPEEPRLDALRETVAELIKLDEPRKRIVGMLTALDVQYDLGAGHPLLGRRMPDLDLRTQSGVVRVFSLLNSARPVLLNFRDAGSIDAVGFPVLDAKYEGPWELPVIGKVSAPGAVLVRPDGHVAWVGESNNDGLDDAISRWFGG